MFAAEGQLTSADARLIAPDEQLERIGHPDTLIPYGKARLFYTDETDLHHCPDTGMAYHVLGEQAKIDSPGKSGKPRYIIGSVEYPTGDGLYQIYRRKRHQEFRAHLGDLLDMYPDDFLFVIRDNASQHVTPKLDEFLTANRDRLFLVPLPTYSPHLNVVDTIWRYMRGDLTRNYFYLTFKEKCEAWVEWLQTLPFERFQSLLGVS